MLLNKLIFLTKVVILVRYILEQNGTYYAQLSKEEALQDEENFFRNMMISFPHHFQDCNRTTNIKLVAVNAIFIRNFYKHTLIIIVIIYIL